MAGSPGSHMCAPGRCRRSQVRSRTEVRSRHQLRFAPGQPRTGGSGEAPAWNSGKARVLPVLIYGEPRKKASNRHHNFRGLAPTGPRLFPRSRSMASPGRKHQIDITTSEARPRRRPAGTRWRRPAPQAWSAAMPRARATSRWTPKPVGPLPQYSRPVSQAVPAMSRWAHGLPSVNSSRKDAA